MMFSKLSRLRRNRSILHVSRSLARIAPGHMARQVKNPFFFIGCGRSGTTLLTTLLSAHPHICVYPGEANEMWHPATYPWDEKRVNSPPIWLNPYAYTKISLQERTIQDDNFLQAVFGAYQYLTGGRCFLNKSVMITFMIDHVRRLFPEARFIHLYRDGRAVALSYLRKEQPKLASNEPEYASYLTNFDQVKLLERFAHHWSEHIREVEKQKANLRFDEEGLLLELSYEIFCEQPEETLTKIAGFMEVDPLWFISCDYSFVKATNHKLRDRLTNRELVHITSLIAPELRLKGYL